MPTIYRAGTFASNIDSDEETIITYVGNNQGKTLAEIQAANSGINANTIEYIINLWVTLQAVAVGKNADGAQVFYQTASWGPNLYAQRANARAWLAGTAPFSANADGKDAATMVTDFAAQAITIRHEHALALFQMLKAEGSAEVR